MISKVNLKHIDLFSGTGGFALGAHLNGIPTTNFVELEPHLQRVLAKNFPEAIIGSDIRDFSMCGLPEADYIVSGGFPCTNISRANWKDGSGIYGEHSSLWFEMFRVIKEGRPKYVLIENVSELLSRGLGTILRDLSEIGYDSCWTLIDSKYCGVPQRRRRVYILGVRDGIHRNADPFKFEERNPYELARQIQSVEDGFDWNLESGQQGLGAITYLTRNRSDKFVIRGVASTIQKRDFKDFTDVIVGEQFVRRLIPVERLRLQGYPDNWLDDCKLTDKQMYMANGMTVPVTKWLFERIICYEKEFGLNF